MRCTGLTSGAARAPHGRNSEYTRARDSTREPDRNPRSASKFDATPPEQGRPSPDTGRKPIDCQISTFGAVPKQVSDLLLTFVLACPFLALYRRILFDACRVPFCNDLLLDIVL